MDAPNDFRTRAEELVARMTVEEKAGQLTYQAPAIPRLGVPAYNWWNEALHGVARAGTATSFPQAIGLGATFDDALLERIAAAVAVEGRAKYNAASLQNDRDIYKGLTFWAPNINLFRDPRWGRGHETYGEDPFLTGRLGVAFIRGLQGDGTYMRAAACAKHFAVHSGPEALRHEFDARVTDKDLWESYLPAFEACVVKGRVEAVMGAYNRTNGEPCCGSTFLLRDVLRGRWGFRGHVVSDCWALKDFHTGHGVTKTPVESAALAMHAGCDLNCGVMYLHLLTALADGLVTEEEIHESAVRLFTTRFKLGLFDSTEYDAIPYDKIECKEHLALSLEAARKSMVLLKNNGILPLQRKNIRTVGVIGPTADSRLVLKGNYYGTSSRYTTILEGIQEEAGEEIRVLYAEGCEMAADRTEPLAMPHDRESEAVAVALSSDIVVLCLGLDETLEGEEKDEGNHYGSGDKEDLSLPLVQRRLLDRVASVGKPVILILTAGSAIDLYEADARCAAVLLAWYPGARGGIAAADILFGKVSPSGKLPVTFYRSLSGLPDFTDYSMKGRTYRYIEQSPLYPFGFGLTYGRVSCSAVAAEYGSSPTDGVLISADLENNGTTDTEDVLQVYLQPVNSPYAARNPSLCGYLRVNLPAGARVRSLLRIPASAFTVVNDKGERVSGGLEYTLYAGFSQPDKKSASLTGVSCAQTVLRFKKE